MARLQTPRPHGFILKLCAQAGVKLKKFDRAEEFEQEVIRFMKSHDILYLATTRDDNPRCTPLGYANRGLTVYILSEGGGKLANLKANPKVSFSIASRIRRGRGLMRVRGLQVWGRAKIISMKEDREKFEEALTLMGVTSSLRRKGVQGLPPFNYRIIKIKPEKIRYLNLPEGINNITWLNR